MLFEVPLHPLVVHFPVALIIISLLFDVVGRATDGPWWRKASLAMLVIAVVAGFVAGQTGELAAEHAEKFQGIAEETLESHGDLAKLSIWLAAGALLARLAEAGMGAARAVVSLIALLLQLAAAVSIGVAGHRGGVLVYRHGAGVTIGDQPVREPSSIR